MRTQVSGWQHFEGGLARQYEQVVSALGYLEARLRGSDVLEVGDERSLGFALLLEWLRPARLCSVELELVCAPRSPRRIARIIEDERTFDAVFVFLPSSATELSLSLTEIARVLHPGGVLVLLRPSSALRPGLDWQGMKRRLEILGFETADESKGSAWFLVANNMRSLEPPAPTNVRSLGRRTPADDESSAIRKVVR